MWADRLAAVWFHKTMFQRFPRPRLLSVALGSHSKWCSVIMAVRDPAQTALSCSKVGMPSAMEEFFQAYYIIAIHLHIVFLQVIAFAWVCLKADSQEQMIVHLSLIHI